MHVFTVSIVLAAVIALGWVGYVLRLDYRERHALDQAARLRSAGARRVASIRSHRVSAAVSRLRAGDARDSLDAKDRAGILAVASDDEADLFI